MAISITTLPRILEFIRRKVWEDASPVRGAFDPQISGDKVFAAIVAAEAEGNDVALITVQVLGSDDESGAHTWGYFTTVEVPLAFCGETPVDRFSKVIDGKCVVNTTPHAITFLNKKGETVVVSSPVQEGERTSPWVVNARPVEEQVGEDLVRTDFVGTPEGEAVLDLVEDWARENGIDNLRVVGSVIAAQAYHGRVLGMCPAPGYERVAPSEKRMTTHKFTVYPAK